MKNINKFVAFVKYTGQVKNIRDVQTAEAINSLCASAISISTTSTHPKIFEPRHVHGTQPYPQL